MSPVGTCLRVSHGLHVPTCEFVSNEYPVRTPQGRQVASGSSFGTSALPPEGLATPRVLDAPSALFPSGTGPALLEMPTARHQLACLSGWNFPAHTSGSESTFGAFATFIGSMEVFGNIEVFWTIQFGPNQRPAPDDRSRAHFLAPPHGRASRQLAYILRHSCPTSSRPAATSQLFRKSLEIGRWVVGPSSDHPDQWPHYRHEAMNLTSP